MADAAAGSSMAALQVLRQNAAGKLKSVANPIKNLFMVLLVFLPTYLAIGSVLLDGINQRMSSLALDAVIVGIFFVFEVIQQSMSGSVASRSFIGFSQGIVNIANRETTTSYFDPVNIGMGLQAGLAIASASVLQSTNQYIAGASIFLKVLPVLALIVTAAAVRISVMDSASSSVYMILNIFAGVGIGLGIGFGWPDIKGLMFQNPDDNSQVRACRNATVVAGSN